MAEMRKAQARGEDGPGPRVRPAQAGAEAGYGRAQRPQGDSVGNRTDRSTRRTAGTWRKRRRPTPRSWSRLKKLGGKQGFLTYDQINDYLDEDASLDEMDEIYASLGKLKVDVVDTVEEGRARRSREKKAKKKPTEAVVGAQPVRFDDPVRMYLREMGRVPLLDRQGEIEIAMRIEQGQDMVMQTVFRSASSVKELQGIGQKIEKEKMSLDEFVRFDAGTASDPRTRRGRPRRPMVLGSGAQDRPEPQRAREARQEAAARFLDREAAEATTTRSAPRSAAGSTRS